MKRALRELQDNNYVYLSNMLSHAECDTILAAIQQAHSVALPQTSMELNDSDDVTNHIYRSKRSPGLAYVYVEEDAVQQIAYNVAQRLIEQTGLNWWNNIQTKAMACFIYDKESAYIKAHRGRDIGYGANKYVAVTMLTKPHFDFTNGEFYINRHAKASEDGKTVWDNHPQDREFFTLEKGDMIIFDNPQLVHGTEPVEKGIEDTQPYRVTTSWRTDGEMLEQ